MHLNFLDIFSLKIPGELKYETKCLLSTIDTRILNVSDNESGAYINAEHWIYNLGLIHKLLQIYQDLR